MIRTIVCSRSVGRGLRAVVYVMVECSYLAVDGMPVEMYEESWIAGLLTSDDVVLHMAGFGTLAVLTAHSWHEVYGSY